MSEWSRVSLAAVLAACLVTLSVHPVSAVRHNPPEPVFEKGGRSLSDVLERYVDASGGESAFAVITSRVLKGRIVTELPAWEPPIHEVDSLSVWSGQDRAFLVVHRTASGVELEGYDGDGAWKRDADGKAFAVHAVDEGSAWLTDPRFPTRLAEHFTEMAYLGVAWLDGSRYDVVDVDGEHSHRLYFDEATGLLSRVGYNRRILRYAAVDGVLVPVEVEYSRKGGSSTFVIDSVVHNAPVDESTFARPGSY